MTRATKRFERSGASGGVQPAYQRRELTDVLEVQGRRRLFQHRTREGSPKCRDARDAGGVTGRDVVGGVAEEEGAARGSAEGVEREEHGCWIRLVALGGVHSDDEVDRVGEMQPGERAMREYQAAAIELGYLHHRYLRGTAPGDFGVRGHEHVEQLRTIRPYISFPGQVVPTR